MKKSRLDRIWKEGKGKNQFVPLWVGRLSMLAKRTGWEQRVCVGIMYSFLGTVWFEVPVSTRRQWYDGVRRFREFSKQHRRPDVCEQYSEPTYF